MGVKLFILDHQPGYTTGQGLYNQLELYPDEGVKLKRQILGDNGLGNVNKQFTREFLVPATAANNKWLGHYEDKSNVTVPDPNRAIPARIEVEGLYTIEGNIELLSVTWKLNVPEFYKVVFYGSTSGIATTMGDTLLSELDWSEFNFSFSIETVAQSWTPGATNYYVPIISWVRTYFWYAGILTDQSNNIGYQSSGVLLGELRVGLRLKDMVVNIGRSFGYTFTFDSLIGGFLEEAFVIPSNSADEYQAINPEQFKIDVQTPLGTTLTLPKNVFTVLDLTYEAYDYYNQWQDGRYFVPKTTGEYSFDISYQALKKTWRTFRLVVNPTNYVLSTVYGGNNKSGTITLTASLTAGVLYRFEVLAQKNDEAAFQLISTNYPVVTYGSLFTAAEKMPVMKCTTFLASFMDTFNLVLVNAGEGGYKFIDVVTLYSTDNVVNLDKYADGKLLTYEKMSVYDLLNYKHKDGEDAPNTGFAQSSTGGRQYAELYFSPNVDFSDGTYEQESIFTAVPPLYLDAFNPWGNLPNYTDMRHHYNLTDEEPAKPAETDFLLLYRNEAITTAFPYYLQRGVNANGEPYFGDPITLYGDYSMVQDQEATENSNALTYAAENTFSGVNALGTITNRFLLEWLLQIYKATSYTLEITFPISFGVFLEIAATTIVYLNKFYHFIAEWEYDSSRGVITLKLLRFDKIRLEPVYVVHEGVQVTQQAVDVIWLRQLVKETNKGLIQLK